MGDVARQRARLGHVRTAARKVRVSMARQPIPNRIGAPEQERAAGGRAVVVLQTCEVELQFGVVAQCSKA